MAQKWPKRGKTPQKISKKDIWRQHGLLGRRRIADDKSAQKPSHIRSTCWWYIIYQGHIKDRFYISREHTGDISYVNASDILYINDTYHITRTCSIYQGHTRVIYHMSVILYIKTLDSRAHITYQEHVLFNLPLILAIFIPSVQKNEIKILKISG